MTWTRLSSKAQVVLLKEIRDRLGWHAGTELEVESEGEAVVRFRPLRRRTSLEEVIGCIPYGGPPVTLAEMDEAVEQAAREMWPSSSGSAAKVDRARYERHCPASGSRRPFSFSLIAH